MAMAINNMKLCGNVRGFVGRYGAPAVVIDRAISAPTLPKLRR